MKDTQSELALLSKFEQSCLRRTLCRHACCCAGLWGGMVIWVLRGWVWRVLMPPQAEPHVQVPGVNTLGHDGIRPAESAPDPCGPLQGVARQVGSLTVPTTENMGSLSSSLERKSNVILCSERRNVAEAAQILLVMSSRIFRCPWALSSHQ